MEDPDSTLGELLTCDASSADLEDANGEPKPDEEIVMPRVSGLELHRPKRTRDL
jgi:hypothetical protein